MCGGISSRMGNIVYSAIGKRIQSILRSGGKNGGRPRGGLWLGCSICIWMAAGVLAGCGQQDGGREPDSESPVSEWAAAPTETEQLVVTYQTLPTSVLEDLDLVTAAVNDITREEIGAEIVFRLADASDAFTEYPLWISKNERIDLMMLGGQDIATYVSRGMLEPMDSLLEAHGGDIQGLLAEGISLTEGAVVKGRTYGVAPVSDLPGKGYGLWAPARLVGETGISYEADHIYTLEELTDFLARCKALYPESYPLGQITSGMNKSTYAWYDGRGLAGGASDFGLLVKDGDVVNIYETPEYGSFLEHMRQWYEAGYIYPDGAFTDAYPEELIESGLVLTYPGSSAPGYEMEALFGEEVLCLRTTQVTLEGGNASSGYWTIPVTSGNPKAAMAFLNLMYSDTRIANLIQYGIASRHYVVLDVESGRISYPYGVSRKTTGYYNPLGLYGDRRKLYTFDTAELIARKEAYLEEAMKNQNQSESFSFEAQEVNLELAAVRKVVEKYVPVLESGSVGEEYYAEFLKELERAGMERVMEEAGRLVEAGTGN